MHFERYWDLSFPTIGAEPFHHIEDAQSQLRNLLVEATRLRLRADVPVGAYLSGGLDSSAIAALIHRYTDNRLETFSIAFADKAFDESDYQWQMAKHLGTRHHLITCSQADIGRVFPNVIWHTEVPILRTGPAPMFLLSELVGDQQFKVVLTGEGADEFLAGYNIFKEHKVRQFWARQTDSQARPALLQRLYPYLGDLTSGSGAYLKKFFGQGLANVASSTYSHDLRWNNTGRSKRLFSEEFQSTIDASRQKTGNVKEGLFDMPCLPPDFDRWSPLARAQYLEATIFLPEYLLSSQGDRMAMAHSVEGRYPFLDHHVVEFCNQLAPRWKLCGLNEKHLLKRDLQDLLPENVSNRPKRPYRAPIHASFFPKGQPLDWVAEMLAPKSLQQAGVFSPGSVEMLIKKLQRFGTLSETDDMGLAGVLSTQLVHQQFIANYRAPGPWNEKDQVKTVRKCWIDRPG
jgi:asparagine synthase (glutamine-hydrolysing)